MAQHSTADSTSNQVMAAKGMSLANRTIVLVMLAGLVLSVLTLGSSEQAQAQASCAEGEQIGLRCEIVAQPTAAGDCAADYEVVGAVCVRYEVVQGLDLSCATGTLVLDQCVEQGAAPAPSGPPLCPVSNTVFEDATNGCYQVSDLPEPGCPDGTVAYNNERCRYPVELVERSVYQPPACPSGFVADANTDYLCARREPALRSGAACPMGARGTAGACYTVEPQQAECFDGDLAGDICLVEGDLPVPGAPYCPTSSVVFDIDGECFTLLPATDGVCQSGLLPDTDPSQCRRPVNLVSGQLTCWIGYALSGSRCIRFEEPTLLGCAPTAPADAFDLCRQPVADRVGEYYCTDASRNLQGVDCELSIAPVGCLYNDAVLGCLDIEPVCPDGFLADPAGTGCMGVVPADQGPESCPSGSRGVPPGCYILVARGPSPTPGAIAACPFGSIEDFASNCRKPVATASGAYYCANPFARLNGRLCVVTAHPSNDCELLDVDTANVEPCAEPVVPAVYGGPGCPVGTLGTAGGCYWYVARQGSADAMCAEGVPSPFGLCELVGVITSFETQCPLSATVLTDDDGGCYVLVARPRVIETWYYPVPCIPGDELTPDGSECRQLLNVPGECPAYMVPDPSGYCRRPVLPVEVPASCESGFVPLSGGCVGFVTQISSDPVCPLGSVEDVIGCRVPVGDATGQFYCEDPAHELTSFSGECLVTAPYALACTDAQLAADECGPAPRACPIGYSPDDSLGGICARFEPASQGPATCPDGARGVAGDCYILVARGPRGPASCDEGVLAGGNCVITGNPPAPGPDICPVSATVSEDADGCFTLVDQQDGACPTDAIAVTDSSLCRLPYETVPGALQCEAGYGLISGQCITYVTPATADTTPSCPEGSTEDDDNNCRKPVADAPGAYFCADAAAALNGRSCVFTAGFDIACDAATGACGTTAIVEVCPAISDDTGCYGLLPGVITHCAGGQLVDGQVDGCREPVELVAQVAGCAVGYVLTGDSCLRYRQAQGIASLDCQGAEASLCDNVVQASQDTPDGSFVSLRPTEVNFFSCAGAAATFVVLDGASTVASGALAESSSGVYSGTYEVPQAGTYELEVTVVCPDGSTNETIEQLAFIDPSGFILDCAGDIVVGAEVTLLRSDTADGVLTVVADGDATIMDPSVNTANPSLSGTDGRYRWDVVPGFYQVSASVAGQASVQSEVLEVPPERTDVDLTFATLNCVQTVSTTRVSSPTLPSPEIVAQPAAADTTVSTPSPVTTTTLALTGSNSNVAATLGLGLIVAGALVLSVGRRVRRFHDEADLTAH